MTHIQAISELETRQATKDRECDEMISACLAAHQDHVPDLAPRPQKIVKVEHEKICEDCGDPEYLVRDQKSGLTLPRCRMSINAIMRQSLTHTQYGGQEICYRCEITYDSLGIINGAIHHTWPIEDFTDQDSGETVAGLKTLIADECFDLTDDKVTRLR